MTTTVRITEAEAVIQAGVSARTLRRFHESGYLAVETSDDGTKIYILSQLVEIFGAAQAAPVTPLEMDTAQIETDLQQLEPQSYYSASNPVPPITTTVAANSPEEHSSSATSSELAEMQRLKNMVALQERILDMKEGEINDLRSQRDWLRTRIERLEEKGDRDQLLLLSETQTIRKLVASQEPRRSTIQHLMEWLGIAPQQEIKALPLPTELRSSSFEIKEAVNQ